MGKDLRGREIGKYITQMPNKKYRVTMPDTEGKRHKKIFTLYYDAERYVANMEYAIEHGSILSGTETTVDAFFEYWISEVKAKSVAPNTLRNFRDRYEHNIKEYLACMIISKIKAHHCQAVLNNMTNKYTTSTIEQTFHTMYGFLHYAEVNDCIPKNPMKSVIIPEGKPSKPTRVLTKTEQAQFLEAAKHCSNYNQFAFVLQTGLRTGELIGLRWDNVDFDNKSIKIDCSLEYRHSTGEWRLGPPKSKSGYRTIPLTDEAVRILKNQQEKLSKLEYIAPEFKNLVFLCRKGTPTKNSTYDTKIYYYCDKAGIKHFSMHSLRHTFATRCIEAGMNPKYLQAILGHSSWNITMNTYVHAQDDTIRSEMKKVSDNLKF